MDSASLETKAAILYQVYLGVSFVELNRANFWVDMNRRAYIAL